MLSQEPIQEYPFERHLSAVRQAALRQAYYLTGNRHDAEDLVQEASVRAFTAYRTFQQGSNFRAWYLRILTNAFLSRYRREQMRQEQVPLELFEDVISPENAQTFACSDQNSDPFAVFIRADLQRAVRSALDTLSPNLRNCCYLFFLQQRTYEEIAHIAGCPVGTVRSRIHRGREHMQASLEARVVNC